MKGRAEEGKKGEGASRGGLNSPQSEPETDERREGATLKIRDFPHSLFVPSFVLVCTYTLLCEVNRCLSLWSFVFKVFMCACV